MRSIEGADERHAPGFFAIARPPSPILAAEVKALGPDDADLFVGRILGPYELLVPAGTGGMAHVWAARHRMTGGVFALKILRPHLAENASFRDMFFDEARIASLVRHENVCATYELVELEGLLTLVMEWVDGLSLLRILRPAEGEAASEVMPRVALPLRHAVKILSETCAGLHAAHDLIGEDGRPLSVVHRDVSPHNVLVTVDGRVKVTDFGVAKALGKLHMTIAGQVKGKLAYMSPEQLVGGGVDRRSDVFALGTVLYEATTGQRPFQGEHDPQVMSAIIMGSFEPPSAVLPGYPRELEAIVLRAIATEPDARYSTALQLRQALEGWLDSSGPMLGPRQIALILEERCGPEIAARARVLTVAPPPVERSANGPGGGRRLEPSGSTMALDRTSDRKSSMGVVGGVLAVVVGSLLGLGVLFYVRETRRTRLAAAMASTATSASTTTIASAPGDPSPPGVLDASVTIVGDLDDEPPPAPAVVKLVVPEGARLYVDGKPLPHGATSVARPDAGVTVVLVRAEGREDTSVVVESDSADELEVSMARKKPRPIAPPPITMPPNPYE